MEFIDTRIGMMATKIFVFIAITISVTAILSGLNLIPGNISATIQVLLTMPPLILLLYLNDRFSVSFILTFVMSVLICIVNEAPYMVSATMMITFIYVLNTIPNINYQKILKWLTLTMFILFVSFVFINLVTGWGSNNYEMWRINGYIYRKSLGFSQPNITMMLWLSCILSLYSLDMKMERLTSIFIGVTTYIIYTQTQSRTSTYIIVFACFISILIGNHIYDRLGKTVSKLISLLPILALLISIYALFHSYSLGLDSILSGRLSLYQQFYSTYGIHFLKTPQLENAMFDNGYLQALLAKGIIFTVQLLCILILIGWKVTQMRIKDMLLFGMYIAIGFTETALQHFELFLPVVILMAQSNNMMQEDRYEHTINK